MLAVDECVLTQLGICKLAGISCTNLLLALPWSLWNQVGKFVREGQDLAGSCEVQQDHHWRLLTCQTVMMSSEKGLLSLLFSAHSRFTGMSTLMRRVDASVKKV